jgi:drug/metabolite transporter (DMT)-like permease
MAMVAAFCFAGSHIASKRGLVGMSVNAGVLITLGSSWLVISIVALWSIPTSIDSTGLALLIAAGVLAPGLGRLAATVGIDRMGPSASVPILGGAYPLLALVGGVGLLGEPVTLRRIIGAFAIVVGVSQLSRRTSDASVAGLEGTAFSLEAPDKRGLDVDAIFPLDRRVELCSFGHVEEGGPGARF